MGILSLAKSTIKRVTSIVIDNTADKIADYVISKPKTKSPVCKKAQSFALLQKPLRQQK
jgi:hypothetical protein